jgi:hypothetical protein
MLSAASLVAQDRRPALALTGDIAPLLEQREMSVAKMAFWRTVGDAYEFAFANMEALAIAASAWVIGLTALAALALFAPTSVPLVVDNPALLRIGELLGEFAFSLAWMRAILLDEAPIFLPWFGRRERRYIGYGIVVSLLTLGILYFSGTFLLIVLGIKAHDYGLTPIPKLWTDVFQVVALIVLLIPASGCLLALPAIALDEEGDVIARGWKRSRGNSVPLGVGVWLCMAPVTGAQLTLETALGGPIWNIAGEAGPSPLPMQTMLATEIDLLLSFFGAAVISGFLALAFRQVAVGANALEVVPAE